MSDDDLIRREGVFMSAVWDALKADTTDLGKQQRILHAFRAANAECGDVSSAEIAIVREEMKNRFGVGEGKLTVIAEPAAPTFAAADLKMAVTWQDLPPDGRPCHTDIFLAQAVDAIDDHYDFRDAVKHWLEGDWDGAMEYLTPPADLAQRVKE